MAKITKELNLEESDIGFGRRPSNDLIILSQNIDMVVNYDDVFAIKVDGCKIIAMGNNEALVMATYKSPERAREVLYKLISCIGLEHMYQLPKE